jgi:hypothetical protein
VVHFQKSLSLAIVVLFAAALTFGASAQAAGGETRIAQQQSDDTADQAQQPSGEAPATDDAAKPAAPESDNADGTTAPAESGGDNAAPPADNVQPAESASPDASESDSAPTATPTPDEGAATAPDDTKAAPDANGAADVAPVKPETPAAASEPAEPSSSTGEASSIDASQLKIGTAVFGSDGAKIGEINGIKSDTSGKVEEILVTAGGAAGLDAKVFAVSGDKITSTSDGVKLSLSSDDAKKLPILDNGNG